MSDTAHSRAEAAVEKGLHEFWRVVAEQYPEITTGDMPPELDEQASMYMYECVRHWVALNKVGR